VIQFDDITVGHDLPETRERGSEKSEVAFPNRCVRKE
jgi:hypothetical protein